MEAHQLSEQQVRKRKKYSKQITVSTIKTKSSYANEICEHRCSFNVSQL